VSVLLNCLISVRVSSTAVWHWGQGAGRKAIDRLNRQLSELAAGQLPPMESLDEAIGMLPLLMGADGVNVPFRPEGGIWRGVKAWLDGRSKKARQWFASARHRLRHGETNAVLNDIAAALRLDGLPETVRKALRNLYEYLHTHHYHIQYQKFKELGLPIGSGMVESACKCPRVRGGFKGVGMRWTETGFNHLLHLRPAWVNGRFEESFALEDSPN
jgi:hypothetical protein